MDKAKIAAEIERISEEIENKVLAEEIDEIVGSKKSAGLRKNPRLPVLNALTNKVVDKIKDRQMLFEFEIMLLRRMGEHEAANFITGIFRRFLSQADGELEV
jgi:hypothetical protein